MSEERIDSYVDRSAVADDTQFLTGQLKTVLDLFEKVNATKITLNGAKGMKDVTDSVKQAQASLAALESSKNKLIKVDLEAAKASLLDAKAKKELALASKAEAQARKENAAAALLEAKALQSEAKAQKESADALLKGQQLAEKEEKQRIATQKQLEELSNDYLQLSRAYTDAAKKAKNYSLVLGENHPATIEAVKDAKAMHDILLRVDQSVGQSQRNVGNYKSAFDGLGMSVTQIARELPSLAISGQQFVLAISNNLPMVADEIARARQEIAALRAQGQEAPTLFQRIASATLSWQVGLSVGIALITAYAGKIGEMVEALFDSEAATRKAAKEQQELNDRIDEGIDLRNKYNETTSRDSGTELRGLENKLAYARAAGKSEIEILKIEKEIATQRQLKAQESFNLTAGEKSLGDIEKDLRSAEYDYKQLLEKQPRNYDIFGNVSYSPTDKDKEKLGELKKEFDHQAKLYDDQKKVVEEFYNANRDAQAKDLELQKALAEQRAKFFADELQYRADILKAFSQIEDGPQSTRLNARKEALKNEKAIIEGQYQDEITAAKKNTVKISEIDQEYKFKGVKLQEDYERDVLAIRQSALKNYQDQIAEEVQLTEEGLKAIHEAEVKATQDRINRRQNQDSINQYMELQSLNNLYEKKLIGEKEYQKRRLDIEKYYSIKAQTDLIIDAQKLIEVRKQNGEDTIELEKNIADIKKSIDDELTQRLIDNREKLKAKEKEVATLVITGIQSLIDNGYERQKNALQEQIDQIETKRQADVDNVNASIASEQEKAAAIANINEKASNQKEQLAKKQREIDVKKAQFDKVIGILKVGIETQGSIASLTVKAAEAKAEAAVLAANPLTAPYAPIALASAAAISAQIPLVLASGAIQAALIAAQPIPKYKGGRNGGPAEWAITGDGGKSEVVASSDLSQAYVTPNTDTLTYLGEGWKVFPNVESFQEVAMSMVHKPLPALPVIHNETEGMIRAMAYSIGRLENAILRKQETHFHWDDGQLKKSITDGINWSRYLQNNI